MELKWRQFQNQPKCRYILIIGPSGIEMWKCCHVWYCSVFLIIGPSGIEITYKNKQYDNKKYL